MGSSRLACFVWKKNLSCIFRFFIFAYSLCGRSSVWFLRCSSADSQI